MNFLFLLIWGFIQMWSSSVEVKTVMWKVTSDSQMEISGTTNINDFQCANLNYQGTDKLVSYSQEPNGTTKWNGMVSVSVNNFDCVNSIMTRDFKNTVQADQFPNIKIKFIDLKNQSNGSDELLEGMAEITLAGVCRRFPMQCKMVNKEGEGRQLIGSQCFLFSDFGLEPPEKFFGAIKVNDRVTVNFKIHLMPIES